MNRRTLLPNKLKIMLDSGAYSAWSKKKQINLDEYIQFIKDNKKWIASYVNLDVIPGAYGRHPTPDETEASAQAGWNNLMYMESKGLFPIPVFHQGEDKQWLFKMVEHNCPYIGISPANDRTTRYKRLWLDEIFSLITDSNGKCKVKTHGFGVTAVQLLLRYPWYSADSTTWSKIAAYGGIYVPNFNLPPPRNLSEHFIIAVSSKSPKQSIQGEHFIHLPENSKDQVEQYLHSLGSSINAVANNYQDRLYINCMFFNAVAKHSGQKMHDISYQYRKGLLN